MKTPNNTSVQAYIQAEFTQPVIDQLNDTYKNTYGAGNYVSTASNTYNSHSYAWNMKERGITCWLNTSPDLHQYWDDTSYEVTTETLATKIHYHSIDYTAIKSSVSGMYEGKFSTGPVMRHSPK